MSKKTDDAVIVAYKGFDADWKCRGFQYEVGKSYVHDGKVEACSSGFHACEYPLDVLGYYPPVGSKFAVVEQSVDLSRESENSDTKIASRNITIKAEIDLPALIKASFEWIYSKCDPVKASHSKADRSASSATGYRSASSATGYRSASSATGDRSASSATGDSSASSATGYRSASSATGYSSASSATGDRSASSATGYRSASSATGDSSASSATGYSSASSATGDRSASLSTGSLSSSEICTNDKPQHAVAISTGYKSKSKAPAGSAIVCVYRNIDGELIHIKASIVGENGIKPDTWYSLSENGDFVEV